MSEEPTPQQSRRGTAAGVLGLFVLLIVLPLMVLALLDVSQGGENLGLEWSFVWMGILAIAVAQVATLSLRWWPKRGGRPEHLSSNQG